MSYTLYNGKMKFPTALAREAHVLLANIRDLNYCLSSNKKQFKTFNSVDIDIMKDCLKSMIHSHKRMIKEMIKTGEYTGDPKLIDYKK